MSDKMALLIIFSLCIGLAFSVHRGHLSSSMYSSVESGVYSKLEQTQSDGIVCRYGNWGPYGACSKPCGNGIQSRTRAVIYQAPGSSCTATTDNTYLLCNPQPCFDCLVSEWSEWEACSHSCGGGTQIRSRTIIQSNNVGGSECPTLSSSKPCNLQSCGPEDCVLGEWSSWSSCSQTCGTGMQTRSRNVTPPKGFLACPPSNEQQPCNTQLC